MPSRTTRMRMKRMMSPRMGTISTRMTTKKRKTKRKKTFSTFLRFFRHPLPPLDHPNIRGYLLFAMLVLVLAPGAVPSAAAGREKQGDSHAHDFVIFANVFTERGFASPRGKVRGRRAD